MSRRQPSDVVLDIAALALVVAAGVLFLYAELGMRALSGGALPQGHFAAIARWQHLLMLSRVAIALGAAGIVLGAVAFVRYARRNRSAAS